MQNPCLIMHRPRHHFASLAAHYHDKGPCKIWTCLVNGFLRKGKQNACHRHNLFNLDADHNVKDQCLLEYK